MENLIKRHTEYASDPNLETGLRLIAELLNQQAATLCRYWGELLQNGAPDFYETILPTIPKKWRVVFEYGAMQINLCHRPDVTISRLMKVLSNHPSKSNIVRKLTIIGVRCLVKNKKNLDAWVYNFIISKQGEYVPKDLLKELMRYARMRLKQVSRYLSFDDETHFLGQILQYALPSEQDTFSHAINVTISARKCLVGYTKRHLGGSVPNTQEVLSLLYRTTRVGHTLKISGKFIVIRESKMFECVKAVLTEAREEGLPISTKELWLATCLIATSAAKDQQTIMEWGLGVYPVMGYRSVSRIALVQMLETYILDARYRLTHPARATIEPTVWNKELATIDSWQKALTFLQKE